MTGERGSSIVEALVGLALGALAVGVLASSVLIGVRAFALANGVGAQATATHDGIERLRHRPAGVMNDLLATVPVIARRCERTAGRGRPDALVVESTWTSVAGPHPFAVASERVP